MVNVKFVGPDDIAKRHESMIVNTVNTIGTMGKGVALAVKERWPEVMPPYTKACRSKTLKPGGILMVETKDDGPLIANLATKENWRDPSQPSWAGASLLMLTRWIREHGWKGEVALTLPGAGNGGLDPAIVSGMIRTLTGGAPGVTFNVLHQDLPVPLKPVYVAGVGSRDTPPDVLAIMTEIFDMASRDAIGLRSGGARGADRACEAGTVGARIKKQIFYKDDPIPEVFTDIARTVHPKPEALSPIGLALMARNGCQVFGLDFTNPSNAVLCWTEGGQGGGGTGQAIRLARIAGIPVIDLGHPDNAGQPARVIYDRLLLAIHSWREERGLPAAPLPKPQERTIPEVKKAKAPDFRSYVISDVAGFKKTKEALGGFSNMATGWGFDLNGQHIPSSEHFYQAMKFSSNPALQQRILDETNPMLAKRIASAGQGIRPDWDDCRHIVMRHALWLKAAHHRDRWLDLYAEAAGRQIVEISNRDDFWGAIPMGDKARGRNVLGRLIMELERKLSNDLSFLLETVPAPRLPDYKLLGVEVGLVTPTQEAKPLAARQMALEI